MEEKFDTDKAENATEAKLNADEESAPQNSIVKCSHCQSTEIRKMSGYTRAGAVAVWGVLAAGLVSKQWHCDKCHSDF